MAEAAALAGWQALDRADLRGAWDFHETAKSAARESGSTSVLAHVIAQQAFVLLDANKPDLAVDVMTQAGADASAVPPMMRAWLAAAKAEALAAAGRPDAARRRIDQAQDLLCDEGSDELPAHPGSHGRAGRLRRRGAGAVREAAVRTGITRSARRSPARSVGLADTYWYGVSPDAQRD
jgi:hypothetical protein